LEKTVDDDDDDDDDGCYDIVVKTNKFTNRRTTVLPIMLDRMR